VAGQSGDVEIGNPVLSGRDVVKSRVTAEIADRRRHQITCLRELHDSLFEMALLLALNLGPAWIRIYIPELGVDPLYGIYVRLNIVAKRLPILLTVLPIFFGILLLFALLIFRFRNNGVQGGAILARIGGQKFGHLD